MNNSIQGYNSENESDHENEAIIALIQAEVIEKQFSSDSFSHFLKKKKRKENISLSEFTIEEMRSFITEFQQNGRMEVENGQSKRAQTISQQIMETEESFLCDNNDNFIFTNKQPKSMISDYQHLTIIISNPTKTSSFLFFGAEYNFSIEVAELSSKVMRTFADFEFFKDTLEMYYPTTYIPPLPGLSMLASSNENYLKRKANYLLMFLNSLTQNPLVISTQLFLDFLQMPKEDFDKLKQSYEETDPPTTIKKFYTLEGLVRVGVEPSREVLSEAIEKNLLSKEEKYKKLNVALKDLLNEFKVISDKMTKVSLAFKELAKVHEDIPSVQQTYLNFEELTKRYANSYLNQQLVFKEDIQEYFKYTSKHFSQFQGVLNELSRNKAKYDVKNVTPEKKCLLNRRELKIIDYLHRTYGYCLNKTIDEYKRLIEITAEAVKNHLQDINSKREKLFGDYLSMASLLEIKNHKEAQVVN